MHATATDSHPPGALDNDNRPAAPTSGVPAVAPGFRGLGRLPSKRRAAPVPQPVPICEACWSRRPKHAGWSYVTGLAKRGAELNCADCGEPTVGRVVFGGVR